MNRIIRTALSRIATVEEFVLEPLDRSHWAAGDYVIGEVLQPPGQGLGIELPNGRMVRVDVGDHVLGAFGARFATLEATGSWEHIGTDRRMCAMTAAGLFGRLTSKAPFMPELTELVYRGHLLVGGHKLTMRDCVPPSPPYRFELPVVLIFGSSMSAGKTWSAQLIVRRLKAMGCRVLAAKLTGAGRFRDVLSMSDAGADAIFDFVDAGLPSTICAPDEYRQAMDGLLARMAAVNAEVAVIEAGASPLEPYNGDTLMALLQPLMRLSVLCASDPYAVVGVMQAFSTRPDLVAGVACNTDAGMALVHKLTGLPCLRLSDPAALPTLDGLLRERLEVGR